MAWSDAAAVIGFTALYVVLGALSFETAFVANNTAAVWIPTGFSLALLVKKGDHLWPVVALGALILNLGDNLLTSEHSLASMIAVASAIAVGNTGEALIGSFLAKSFAGGQELLSKPVNVVVFAGLNSTLPPLVSMGVGATASYLGGLVPSSHLREVMLTWYLADAVGVLILTAPLMALLDSGSGRVSLRIRGTGRFLEATGLIAGLVFASQAMSGVYVVAALRNWPRAYMIIPLLLWAVFRFRTKGVLIAILLVAGVSVVGTMEGFEAFPAATNSRSLLYLQLFLGLMSVTTLAITAALSEIETLQIVLEDTVKDRTNEVERLVRSRALFSTLVVHDLQSPLQDIRNALRAAARALGTGGLSKTEAIAVMNAMDRPCSMLAERVVSLLDSTTSDGLGVDAQGSEALAAMIDRIVSARGFDSERVVRRFSERDLSVKRPTEVERILEGLVDNAVKHGPPRSTIEICAYRHGANLEILVIDDGGGADISALVAPFRATPNASGDGVFPARGRWGHFLAGEQARAIGGRLTYCMSSARTTFRLILPS